MGWAAGEARQPELCYRAAVTGSRAEGSQHCGASVLALPQVVCTTLAMCLMLKVPQLLACTGGQKIPPLQLHREIILLDR